MTDKVSYPAFPCTSEHGVNYGHPGISERVYIATKALQAIISLGQMHHTSESHVDLAYYYADLMLEQQNETAMGGD